MTDLMVFDKGIANHDTTKTPIEVLLQVGEDGKVSARDTYGFLGLSDKKFTRWARTNILENSFAIDGEDYIARDMNVPTIINGTVMMDYRLSVPFAKKLCMLCKTERGEQAREYFIKVEDALKNVAQNLPKLTTNELVLKIAENNVELEKRVNSLESKLDTALQVFSRPNVDHWRADMENKIDAIVESQRLSPVAFRGKLYRELEQTANARLQNRLSHLKGRMKRQGASYKERQAMSKLDIISKDKQLRAIFEGVVQKYQAVYSVLENAQ